MNDNDGHCRKKSNLKFNGSAIIIPSEAVALSEAVS